MLVLWLLTAFTALFGLVLLVYAFVAFGKRRVLGGLLRLAASAIFLGVAALSGLLALGSWGYQALFAEQTAATVQLEQLAPQRFRAEFVFPDGSQRSVELAGDQLYVDARILKWHPYATLLGVKTAYQLERVAGRYASLDDEQTEPRTVFALQDAPPVDLFALTERYAPLTQLVDAEYGSASFQDIEDGQRFEVRVTTSGLILRELE